MGNGTKPYLVALDNSPRSSLVLGTAIGLAKAASTKLVLFRAVGLPGDLPVEAYAMPPDHVIDVLRQRASRELEEAARAIPTGVPFAIRVEVGTPWQAICTAGEEENAALIVLGSHGYSGLDRLLGTTAARVVNHANRSVLVVRPAEAAGRKS